MDLEDFVSSTLVQIVNGVVKANEELKDTGAWVNPAYAFYKRGDRNVIKHPSGLVNYVRNVEFDVAVTASDEQKAGAGAGVKVVGIKLGAEGEVKYENSTVSRVQFVVPIALPTSVSEGELERVEGAKRQYEAQQPTRRVSHPGFQT